MQSFRWERQGWGGTRWALVGNGTVVATLRRSGWTGSAQLASSGGHWTLTASGLWTRRIRVTDAHGREVAWAELRSNGVDVHGPFTGEGRWRASSWWKPAYEWHSGGKLGGRLRARSARGDVDLEESPAAFLIAALGWLGWLWLMDSTAEVVVATT